MFIGIQFKKFSEGFFLLTPIWLLTNFESWLRQWIIGKEKSVILCPSRYLCQRHLKSRSRIDDLKCRTSESQSQHFSRTLTKSAARTSMQSPPPGTFWCQITNNGKRPIPALLDTTPSFPINHSSFGHDQKKRKTFEQGHMHAKGQEKATSSCVFFYFLKYYS